VHAPRAATTVHEPELLRIRRVADVPEHEPAQERRVVARAAAHLDPRDGDVAPGERAVLSGVDDDILSRGSRRVLQRGNHLRVCRLADVDHLDTGFRPGWAETLRSTVVPVNEPPLPDVGETVMRPHVGIEATTSQIGVANHLHTADGAGLLTVGEGWRRRRHE
jgi:hypothetical protein